MDKAMEIAGQLSRALKVPAERVWAALAVKQQVLAWSNTLTALMWLTLIAALSLCGCRLMRERGDGQQFVGFVMLVTAAVMLLGVTCASTFAMNETLMGFAAPEAGAALELLKAVTGK